MFGRFGKRKNDGSEEPLNWDEEGVFAPRISEEDFLNLPIADIQDVEPLVNENIEDALAKAKRGEKLSIEEAETLKEILIAQGHLPEERQYLHRVDIVNDENQPLYNNSQMSRILRAIESNKYKPDPQIIYTLETLLKSYPFPVALNKMRGWLGFLFEYYLKFSLFERKVLAPLNKQQKLAAAISIFHVLPDLRYIDEKYASIFTQAELHLQQGFTEAVFEGRGMADISKEFVQLIIQSYITTYLNSTNKHDFVVRNEGVMRSFVSKACATSIDISTLISKAYLKTINEMQNNNPQGYADARHFIHNLFRGHYSNFMKGGGDYEF